MIHGMFEHGTLPVLERVAQFTAARQKVLAHNIANLSTPYFKPADLDPRSFQTALARAIDQRRSIGGTLKPADTDEVRFGPAGLDVRPSPTNDSILFHDQNNRDLERTMQHLAENTLAHQATMEMIRNEFDMLRLAIRERL